MCCPSDNLYHPHMHSETEQCDHPLLQASLGRLVTRAQNEIKHLTQPARCSLQPIYLNTSLTCHAHSTLLLTHIGLHAMYPVAGRGPWCLLFSALTGLPSPASSCLPDSFLPSRWHKRSLPLPHHHDCGFISVMITLLSQLLSWDSKLLEEGLWLACSTGVGTRPCPRNSCMVGCRDLLNPNL